MNANRFTQKSLEALQSCEKLAREYGNPEIKEVHLAYALVTAEGGLIPTLLARAGVNETALSTALKEEVEKLLETEEFSSRSQMAAYYFSLGMRP